jgi:adenylylsulfate kinase
MKSKQQLRILNHSIPHPRIDHTKEYLEVAKKYSLFIGRFSPFHNGHDFIIRKALDEGKAVLLAVMNTEASERDPYCARLRVSWLRIHYYSDDVKVIIIPPIESVNIGRDVGYAVNEIEVPDEVRGISATDIRSRIKSGDKSWISMVPSAVSTSISRGFR